MSCYTCKKCEKEFDRKSDLTRHHNRKISCDSNSKTRKKDVVNVIEDNIEDNTRVSKIKYPVNFCQDGIANITGEELIAMLKNDNNFCHSMITVVNFNESKPEHHNVYMENLDDDDADAIICIDHQWMQIPIDQAINVILITKLVDATNILVKTGHLLRKHAVDKIVNSIASLNQQDDDEEIPMVTKKKHKTFLKKGVTMEDLEQALRS